jgi:alkanesulfonate monooxygenase SsuD/methylene tetrahydromethanopterin reductase-like flavin-dependent oxidoreductase (luciferase family)
VIKLNFGFCAPVFAGAGDNHAQSPLLERVDTHFLADAIVEAEQLGYDSLWVPDHLMLGRDSLILEGLTFLAWASRLTSMRLGTIHLSNILRSPALTAKMIATLDVISEGRVEFFFEGGHQGIRAESEAYGYEFGDESTLAAKYIEAIQLIKSMWQDDHPSFSGKHYQINGAICQPRPVQSPHPPIWIGAFPKIALNNSAERPQIADVIAKYADGCKVGPSSVSDTRAMLKTIEHACSDIGRDFSGLNKLYATQILIAESESQVQRIQDLIISRNPNTPHHSNRDALRERYLIGDVKTVTRRIQDYAELGINNFYLWFMDYPSLDGVRLFANEVMPYFKED